MRNVVPMMLLVLLLLAGCKANKNTVQSAIDFRTQLMDAGQCAFTAEATADFGSRVFDFTLDCRYLAGDQSAELTVQAPETIAGITATVTGDKATVQFDGAGLELGTTGGGNLAPLQLPQLLGNAWISGYIDAVSEHDEGSLVLYRLGYEEDELLIYTYFDADGAPYLAEIYEDGDCVLTAELENFSMA